MSGKVLAFLTQPALLLKQRDAGGGRVAGDVVGAAEAGYAAANHRNAARRFGHLGRCVLVN